MFDSLFCNLGNVNHSLFARCKFDECTKFFDAYYFTSENLTFFKISCNDTDHVSSFLKHCFIGTTDAYCTFIIDVNLNTSAVDNLVDCLTLLSYYITNLSRVNLNLKNLWSILSNFFSWLSNCFGHNFVHDIKSCFPGSSDCFFYDRSC